MNDITDKDWSCFEQSGRVEDYLAYSLGQRAGCFKKESLTKDESCLKICGGGQ